MKELRNKARSIGKTGVVPTLDANATVVKSDSLIDPELHEAVKQAFKDLIAEQATNPDWHPGSNNLVQDLLHPSMYPLVYGESKVIAQEVVGVEDAIPKWAGKGDVIKLEVFDDEPTRFYAETENNEGGLVPSCFWSEKYQWLPANLAFQDDGSVKFTSYINNLHPTKHSGIYRTIEKLVEKALPMWDQCLSTIEGYEEDHHRGGAGRTRSRYIDLGDCE